MFEDSDDDTRVAVDQNRLAVFDEGLAVMRNGLTRLEGHLSEGIASLSARTSVHAARKTTHIDELLLQHFKIGNVATAGDVMQEEITRCLQRDVRRLGPTETCIII